MKISGVYKITNIVSGKFYIGSSKDTEKRKLEHWQALNRNEHRNTILQNSWNYHGEDKFTFEIIETCADDQCLIREQHYLDLLQPFKGVGYNINRTANGGDGYTYNPRREEIIEKLKIMSTGENNGMFGKKHTEEAKQKQKASSVGRYTLTWFIERDGEELGTKKYHERREMLASRKINYRYDNGLKGKKRVVESTRGSSVSRGKMALKGRKEEFAKDIADVGLSMRQVADKYGLSLAAIKYHRKKHRAIIAASEGGDDGPIS